MVNGLPNLAAVGASCCGLTKLSLWGEAPAPPPGQKSPRTFRSLSCNLGAHVSQLLNLKVQFVCVRVCQAAGLWQGRRVSRLESLFVV